MTKRRAVDSVKKIIAPPAIMSDILKVKFYGVRGSDVTTDPNMGMFGQDTSCVVMEAAGKILVFDTGSGFRKFCQDYTARFQNDLPPLDIFISHFHKDHFDGMHVPPLMFDAKISKTIWGGVYKERPDYNYDIIYTAKDAHQYAFSGPISPGIADIHTGLGNVEFRTWETPHNIISLSQDAMHPLTIKTCILPHGIDTCLGYRVETQEGVICLLTDFDMTLAKLADYPQLVDFVRGADLVIADGMFTERDLAEMPHKKKFGHGTVEAIVQLARAARVTDVCITHHDVSATDDMLEDKEEYSLKYGRKHGVNVTLARQGRVVLPNFSNIPLTRLVTEAVPL